MDSSRAAPSLPRLFIGSSFESLHLAEAIQSNLAGSVDSVVWNQGLFTVGKTMLDVLERRLCDFDYAVLVMTPEGEFPWQSDHPRFPAANLLVEAGLFLAHLGHTRTFLVCPSTGIQLPTDLQGLNFATFSSAKNGNARSLLAAASDEIRDAICRISATSDVALLPGQVARRKRFDWVGTAIAAGPDEEMRIVNLSVTGAFLETGLSHPQPGERLKLNLSLRGGVTVLLDAEVVRVQTPAWKRIGGVGVRFTEVNDTIHRRLEEFLEESESAA